MLKSKMNKFILAGTIRMPKTRGVNISPRSYDEELLFLVWFDHYIWVKRDGIQPRRLEELRRSDTYGGWLERMLIINRGVEAR